MELRTKKSEKCRKPQPRASELYLHLLLCPGLLERLVCDQGPRSSFLLPELTKHINCMQCSDLINFPHWLWSFHFKAPKDPTEGERIAPVCVVQPLMMPFAQEKGFSYQVTKLHNGTFPLLLYQYLISIDSFLGSVPFQNLHKWTFSLTEPFKEYIWSIFKPKNVAFKQVMYWFALTLNYLSPDFPKIFPEAAFVVHWTQKTNHGLGWVGVLGTREIQRLFSRSLSLVEEIRHFEK